MRGETKKAQREIKQGIKAHGICYEKNGKNWISQTKGVVLEKLIKKDANPKTWFQVMPPVPNKILQKI